MSTLKLEFFSKIFFRVAFLCLFLYNRKQQATRKEVFFYMWKYKVDILKELSNRGYTSPKMRRDKIISEGTIQRIREGKGITTDTLNTICLILRCQPSDIIEIIPTDEEKIKYF